MISPFDLNNSIDSEDDCDYEPPADELSSDEAEPLPSSDDEKETKRKSRNRQKKSKSVLELENKSAEECKLVSNIVDEKKRAVDVYKSFLDDVAAVCEVKDVKNECVLSGISCSDSTTNSVVLKSNRNLCQSSTANTPEKLDEFAGEIMSVNNNVKLLVSDSYCTPDFKIEKTVPLSLPTVKRKGLESVLGSVLNKKQKLTTLTKSMLDWKSFKKEEGIEEELASYNRGKGGFLERRRFLERSDVRSFEIERDMRLTKRQTSTKRDI